MHFTFIGTFPFFHPDGWLRTWYLWAACNQAGQLVAIRFAFKHQLTLASAPSMALDCLTPLAQAAWSIATSRVHERRDDSATTTSNVIPFRRRFP